MRYGRPQPKSSIPNMPRWPSPVQKRAAANEHTLRLAPKEFPLAQGRGGVTRAVFFDVDFTLIYPGPRFQASGYQASCARHGIAIDASRFATAVSGAASVLDA